MSFDIFVQAFRHGNRHDVGASAVHDALAPFLVEGKGGWHLRAGLSSAELYGVENLGTGFMVTHVDGDELWDVLVQVARACDLVIMPVGVATAITRPDQVRHLPEEIREGAELVTSGAELRELIRR